MTKNRRLYFSPNHSEVFAVDGVVGVVGVDVW